MKLREYIYRWGSISHIKDAVVDDMTRRYTPSVLKKQTLVLRVQRLPVRLI